MKLTRMGLKIYKKKHKIYNFINHSNVCVNIYIYIYVLCTLCIYENYLLFNLNMKTVCSEWGGTCCESQYAPSAQNDGTRFEKDLLRVISC